MSDVHVSLVPSEYVLDVWPGVEPFIVEALKFASGK